MLSIIFQLLRYSTVSCNPFQGSWPSGLDLLVLYCLVFYNIENWMDLFMWKQTWWSAHGQSWLLCTSTRFILLSFYNTEFQSPDVTQENKRKTIFYEGVQRVLRSLTAWGNKLLCSSHTYSRVNRRLLGWRLAVRSDWMLSWNVYFPDGIVYWI